MIFFQQDIYVLEKQPTVHGGWIFPVGGGALFIYYLESIGTAL